MGASCTTGRQEIRDHRGRERGRPPSASAACPSPRPPPGATRCARSASATSRSWPRESPQDFAAVFHPDFFNHEQRDEPPATRGLGPAPAHRVAEWLHAAYGDLRWQLHDTVVEDDLAVLHATMRGVHSGPFVAYDAGGRVDAAFAPTGRRFASTQSHWVRVREGRIIEHWANRDDLGTARQLGWVPPTLRSLVRNALATRRARRVADPPRRAEERRSGRGAASSTTRRRRPLRALDVMRGAPLEAFARLYHPDALNREQVAEPPATRGRGRGPATFHATSRWLNDAFAELDWTVHHVAAEGDLVALHTTMSGRHTAPIAFYDEDARVDRVFPPTGRWFAVTQTHWLRLAADGRVLEHRADRDDLGMTRQLGWAPPAPGYALRAALARRRAPRAA